jgi:inorganic pyrophosphatase
VLVITPIPLITGVVVRCRPVGMLKMTDEAGPDSKMIAVPIDKLCGVYMAVRRPEDLAPSILNQISHFFEHYKDLEADKWVKVHGWAGADDARAEIMAGVERYRNAEHKPAFS